SKGFNGDGGDLAWNAGTRELEEKAMPYPPGSFGSGTEPSSQHSQYHSRRFQSKGSMGPLWEAVQTAITEGTLEIRVSAGRPLQPDCVPGPLQAFAFPLKPSVTSSRRSPGFPDALMVYEGEANTEQVSWVMKEIKFPSGRSVHWLESSF
ncbi:hypothetical protein STEG23_013949, partial [Scotinomys teguina]